MASIKNAGFNTTKGKLHIIAEKTLEKLDIQFYPAELSTDYNPNIATIQVVGRNLPRYQLLGGEATLTMQLDFHADESSKQSVTKKCDWLRSLTMVDRKKGAQRVKIVFGELYKNEMWIVKSVKVKSSLFDEANGCYPRQAYVDITFGLDMDKNLNWIDVL